MPPVITRYALDPTGVNPDNLVSGEIHEPPRRKVRAIAPLYGAFFTESVQLYDVVNQKPLARGVQFDAVELYELPTARYGKEICGILLINDPTVGDKISLTYQTLGGEFGSFAPAILDMLNRIENDAREVAWGDLVAKPSLFPPSHHLHDVGDVYGFEYLVHATDRVRRAIEVGDAFSHDPIYRYIDQKVVALSPFTPPILDALDKKVPWTAKATVEQARSGLNDTTWMTPYKTAEAIAGLVVAGGSETVAGRLQLATVAETKAGVDTTKATHSAGIKAAITDALAAYSLPLGTEAVKGILELASITETIAGTDTSRAVHPAGLAAAVQQALAALINSAPTTMDTLRELSIALGNDPNFATTMTAALAGKASLSTSNIWTAVQAMPVAVLVDAVSVAWNAGTIQIAKLTLGGNRTLAAPTNVKEGALYTLRVTQDLTGTRTLAFNAAYKFGSAGAPVLTATAGKTDLLFFIGGAGNTMEFTHARLNAI